MLLHFDIVMSWAAATLTSDGVGKNHHGCSLMRWCVQTPMAAQMRQLTQQLRRTAQVHVLFACTVGISKLVVIMSSSLCTWAQHFASCITSSGIPVDSNGLELPDLTPLCCALHLLQLSPLLLKCTEHSDST